MKLPERLSGRSYAIYGVIGLSVGISIGAAIGAALDNIGVGVAVGLGAGVAIGSITGHLDREKNFPSERVGRSRKGKGM